MGRKSPTPFCDKSTGTRANSRGASLYTGPGSSPRQPLRPRSRPRHRVLPPVLRRPRILRRRPPRNHRKLPTLVAVIGNPLLARVAGVVEPRLTRPAPRALFRAVGAVKVLLPRPTNPSLPLVVDIVEFLLSRPIPPENKLQRRIVNHKAASEQRSE